MPRIQTFKPRSRPWDSHFLIFLFHQSSAVAVAFVIYFRCVGFNSQLYVQAVPRIHTPLPPWDPHFLLFHQSPAVAVAFVIYFRCVGVHSRLLRVQAVPRIYTPPRPWDFHNLLLPISSVSSSRRRLRHLIPMRRCPFAPATRPGGAADSHSALPLRPSFSSLHWENNQHSL